MKPCFLSILILTLFAITSQAQSRHSLFLNTGYTFSNNLKINGKEIHNSEALLLTFGLAYKAFSFNTFSTEIGLAGKTIFSSGKIGDDDYDAKTLRLAMPVKFVIPFSNKWTAASGFIFQNNVDISEFDFRLRDKYSWRVDLLVEARYALNEIWYLTTGITLNLRDTPDAYFINDPKAGIQIGIARHTFIFKKKKL